MIEQGSWIYKSGYVELGSILQHANLHFFSYTSVALVFCTSSSFQHFFFFVKSFSMMVDAGDHFFLQALSLELSTAAPTRSSFLSLDSSEYHAIVNSLEYNFRDTMLPILVP